MAPPVSFDSSRPIVETSVSLPPNSETPALAPRSDSERRAMLRSAFENLERPSRPWQAQSPLLYSPVGAFASLAGCTDHPPLWGEPGDSSSGDGGHDAGTPRPPDAGGGMDSGTGGIDAGSGGDGGTGGVDAGTGGDGGMGGVDGGTGGDGGMGGVDGGTGGDGGGPPEPVCQVRFPVAVLFYDCVDMAPTGGPTTHVCLSDQHFGGDVAAARSFVERGLQMTHELYANGCSPMVVEPVMFYPGETLNAQEGVAGFNFFAYPGHYTAEGEPRYLINPDIPYFSGVITALGDDPTRFGAIAVLNAWDTTILLSDNPGTYDYSWRATPPFAVVGRNFSQLTDPLMPSAIRADLRHEFTHGLDYISRHYAFPRPIYVHTPPVNPACLFGGDAHWLCKSEYDGNGVPMLAEDWQLALGAVGVPVTCEDPAYQASCGAAPPVTCGPTVCPDLPQFSAYCNTENYCEYSPETVSEPWQLYNRFIYVPPGSSFTLGSNPGDPGHRPEEAPATAVTFSTGYYLGKYEVPVEAYEACRAAGGCLEHNTYGYNGNGWGVNESATRPLHPANHLSQSGAWGLCEFLIPGGRLPTRAEWEFGARGPMSLTYPFGNSAPVCADAVASFNEAGTVPGFGCSSGGTRPVDSMPMGASPIGAFNMAGNVWEFTSECWEGDQSGIHPDGSPRSWPCVSYHELAGGGFNDPAEAMRGARRTPLFYNFGNANVGVRCALSASWVHE